MAGHSVRALRGAAALASIVASIATAMTIAMACSACGSSSASAAAATSNEAGIADAGAGDAPLVDEVGLLDAGEQDPNVYPAMHAPLPQVTDHGGPVLLGMKIVTVTFAGDTLGDELATFDDMLVTSPWWTAVAKPYGLDPGTSGGYVQLADTVSGKTIDNGTDLHALIQAKVSSNELPAPDKNTLYVLYFPASATVLLGGQRSCVDFNGFHESMTVTRNGQTTEVAYAVLPRCHSGTAQEDKDNLTYAASHEVIEAATDPSTTSDGFDLLNDDAWTTLGGEVADMCENRGSVTLGAYAVTRSWVNSVAAASGDPCQPTSSAETYFGLAVDTETADVHGTSGDYSSAGYLTIKRGETKSFRAVVFSQRKLPGDLTLVVGAPSATASADPRKLGPILPGVVTTLSRTTGHNGNGVVITISVPENAAANDTLFIARAVAMQTGTPTDFHSWPVILRIQ